MGGISEKGAKASALAEAIHRAGIVECEERVGYTTVLGLQDFVIAMKASGTAPPFCIALLKLEAYK